MDVIDVGNTQKKLQFSIPASDVRQELDKAYNNLKRRVRLHGFRPGKAPRRVLEARFGTQVKDDVAATLIQQGYTDALEQKAIEPVGRPEVTDRGDLEANADFEFAITVDVRPSIELDNYEGLEVEYPKVEVTEGEIDVQIQALLEGQARLVEVNDRAAEKGDMVLTELTAKDGEEEIATEPGTMIRTAADPYYPGAEDLVVGLKVGEEKSAKITFGESAITEAVAGRELDVTVKVVSIQANEVPELSDEVAAELGYEGGADGMKAAVSAQIAETRDEMARNQARANALQALIDANPFDVPEGMIEQQLEALIEELRLQAAYRGQDPRSLNFDAAQMADLRVRALFAVKGGLILDFISNKEGIEVTEADLEAKYQELADERGQTVEAIKGYFVKDDVVDELRSRLLEEKTLDLLLEKSKLVEAKPAAAVPEAAEAEDTAAAAGDFDASVLAGKVGDIKKAISSGDHDAHLADILAAEQDGKARKGVIAAIEGRQAKLG
jgi:trigger factor